MGACGLKTLLKFIMKMKQNSQIFLIHFFRLQNWSLSKNQKERRKRKSHLFLNSFSADQIDVFSELL